MTRFAAVQTEQAGDGHRQETAKFHQANIAPQARLQQSGAKFACAGPTRRIV